MSPDYSAVLLRFGEIAIKSDQTRRRMTRLLISHVREALDMEDVPYDRVVDDYGRIFIYTERPVTAARVASRVFGVVSTSPVVVSTAALDEVLDAGVALARDTFERDRSFAVGARRTGSHDFTSQDIRERLGACVLADLSDYNLHVNLDSPDQTLYVEVRRDRAYLFTETFEGVGGMPTGSQGKVVCTVSTGLDSPIAAYKVMRRGCIPVFVFFDNSPHADSACSALAVEQARRLAEYVYGYPVKMYIVPHGPDLDEALRHGPPRLVCVFCKRNMLRLAQRIAHMEHADAIVTGEIIGEQASQTTANLRVIDSAVTDFPVLRPCAGDDKVDIERMAMRVGTYEFATGAPQCCTLAPKFPAVKARMDAVLAAETDMDLSVLDEEIRQARVVMLRSPPQRQRPQ